MIDFLQEVSDLIFNDPPNVPTVAQKITADGDLSTFERQFEDYKVVSLSFLPLLKGFLVGRIFLDFDKFPSHCVSFFFKFLCPLYFLQFGTSLVTYACYMRYLILLSHRRLSRSGKIYSK